jgi:hypothetical protein
MPSTGAPVTSHTTGASAQFTLSGTSITFVVGEVIKVVKSNGEAFYYEVSATGTNTVTIRTPVTNTWLSFANFAAPSAVSDFAGGRVYVCTTNGTRTTSGATAIVVTGEDIDAKANIVCEANRP